MTREEVIKGFKEDALYPLTGKQLIKAFNDIYNDFESRTCENCKFCIEDSNEDGYWVECKSESSLMFGNSLLDEQGNLMDFGCNRFDRKDKNV